MNKELTVLTSEDRARFDELKEIVKAGLGNALRVGQALMEIKEKEFWKSEGYKSFGEFCNVEFEVTKRYADQLILDNKTFEGLPEKTQKLITSGKTLRVLAGVPEKLRPGVIDIATEGGKKEASSEDVKKVAKPVVNRTARIPLKPSVKSPKKQKEPEGKKPKGPVDKTGIEIPEETRASWQEATETAMEILSHIRVVRTALERNFSEENNKRNPMWSEVDKNSAIANIKQTETDLERAIPYAVCHACNGKAIDGCEVCSGRGWVSKFYYDTFVPEEIKALRKQN